MISKKTKWVRTDAWRGYEQPINAVAGANDTGTWEDSPCRTDVAISELKGFCALLRKAKIPYVTSINRSSNVFCAHRYVLVAPEHREQALALADQYDRDNQTRLFYTCKN